jgi:hypothetical protein
MYIYVYDDGLSQRNINDQHPIGLHAVASCYNPPCLEERGRGFVKSLAQRKLHKVSISKLFES